MKTPALAALLATAFVVLNGMPCLAGGIRIGDTPAARIAKDTSIPGKGKPGQCLPFAVALQKKFTAAGISARVVVYGYEVGGVPSQDASTEPVLGTAGTRGSHAVVVYDDDGRTCVMDNQSWAPQWVHTAAPRQMAQQFSGINYSVKMARVLNDRSAPKALALPVATVRLAAN
jgi:hypothetical protein